MLWVGHAFNRETELLHPSEARQLRLPLVVCHAQLERRWFMAHRVFQMASSRWRHVVDTFKHQLLET